MDLGNFYTYWNIFYCVYFIFLLINVFGLYYKRILFKKKYPFMYDSVSFTFSTVICKHCDTMISSFEKQTELGHIATRIYRHQNTHKSCVIKNKLRLACKIKKKEYSYIVNEIWIFKNIWWMSSKG